MYIHLLRHEMLRCDLYLLLHDITAHLDQFHTIQQWLGNRIQIISGSDKHHLA